MGAVREKGLAVAKLPRFAQSTTRGLNQVGILERGQEKSRRQVTEGPGQGRSRMSLSAPWEATGGL